ncbi:hypothetical protein RRG08_052770 [Elysia crispata]|uniref:Uncharacterized protein n=1 Tax=Elysia crispata TaxID=231223 RepID=A0AAE1EBB8_9GAST|nr:hypothetical protein RRG08_052770 [Elysia crispata]
MIDLIEILCSKMGQGCQDLEIKLLKRKKINIKANQIWARRGPPRMDCLPRGTGKSSRSGQWRRQRTAISQESPALGVSNLIELVIIEAAYFTSCGPTKC